MEKQRSGTENRGQISEVGDQKKVRISPSNQRTHFVVQTKDVTLQLYVESEEISEPQVQIETPYKDQNNLWSLPISGTGFYPNLDVSLILEQKIADNVVLGRFQDTGKTDFDGYKITGRVKNNSRLYTLDKINLNIFNL